MEIINFILSICSIIIPVFATVYTVNNRIKNSNRENHQPYLILDNLERIDNIETHKYYLTVKCNFFNCHKSDDKNQATLNTILLIKNIGYGVATNIKLYDLLTGNLIERSQERQNNIDQKLFTTFDIGAGDTKKVQTSIISLLLNEKSNIIEDYAKLLCVYKDLHNNIYSFIINITFKNKQHYDFSAFQESSNSYQRIIKEHKKNYKKIIKDYSEY